MRTPQQWREAAAELRTLAAGMHDPGSRATLLRIAVDYDSLARQAEIVEAARKGLAIPDETGYK